MPIRTKKTQNISQPNSLPIAAGEWMTPLTKVIHSMSELVTSTSLNLKESKDDHQWMLHVLLRWNCSEINKKAEEHKRNWTHKMRPQMASGKAGHYKAPSYSWRSLVECLSNTNSRCIVVVWPLLVTRPPAESKRIIPFIFRQNLLLMYIKKI